MNPTDLWPHTFLDVLHILIGLAALTLLGLAWADRLMPDVRGRLIAAPVFACTVLPLAAILLDFTIGVPVNAWATWIIVLLLTIWGGWPRRKQVQEWLRRRPPRPSRATWLLALGLLTMGGFVASLHAIPHIPSDGDESEAPYMAWAERMWDGVRGNDHPYPIHVDELAHMASTGAIIRQQTVDIQHPYSGHAYGNDLFTISGFRSERGFELLLAQAELVTGASGPFIHRVLPSLWAGYLAIATWMALTPARGAALSGLLVGILPTNVRVLGPGLLVPITFALPWLPVILTIALHGRDARRFVALLLLITGAFFLHLVGGTLALVIGLTATLLRPGAWRERASAALPVLLPLLWVIPPVAQDAVAAVNLSHGLPFAVTMFAAPTMMVWVFVSFAVSLFITIVPHIRPHKAIAVLGALAGLSIMVSYLTGHDNTATYDRVIPAFFWSTACLAGLGIAQAAHLIASRLPRPAWRPHVTTALGVAMALAVMTPSVAGHMETEYYRIFDDESWRAISGYVALDPDADSVFFAQPWQAPLVVAATGTVPFIVMTPGNVPPDDFDRYLAGDLPASWYTQNGIDYVIGPIAPRASHEEVARYVWRITA